MKAEYKNCERCGLLVWSPVMYRHVDSQECRQRAALHALAHWVAARRGTDAALREAADEVLFAKAGRLYR